MTTNRTYTLYNDLHRTSVRVRATLGAKITDRQARRINAALCGVRGCGCGGALGVRGGPLVATLHCNTMAETWYTIDGREQ